MKPASSKSAPVQQKPKNNRRSWPEVLREAQDFIDVKDSDSEDVEPPCRPGTSAGSGVQKASEEPGDPSSQAQQPEETPTARPWKYAKAARAQESHEGVQPMAAAARGRGYRALCRADMEGVVAGHHMISSWNQAFFQGIQQEEGSKPAPAGADV